MSSTPRSADGTAAAAAGIGAGVDADDGAIDAIDGASDGTSDGPVRRVEEGDTEYAVFPVTAQKEGVYRYPLSDGRIAREYLDGEELTAPLDEWDGVPIVLRHPVVNRDGEPAYGLTRDPTAQYVEVGELRDADLSTDTTLRGFAWVRANEIGRHGGDLESYIRTLENGGYGEVSTGYSPERVEPAYGRYNGEPYDGEQVGIDPDHLALLPDETGNCPVSGGCGAGRINAAENATSGLSGPIRANSEPVATDGGAVANAAAADSDRDPDPGAGENETMTPTPTGTGEQVRTNVLSQARRPTYSGTETQSWGDIPATTLSHYVDNLDLSADNWDDLNQSERQEIAEHTLLGDPNADTADDGIFFPVVNASTGSLNRGGLEAVRGGRGQSANIPDDAYASAFRMAGRLLNDEFDADVDLERSNIAGIEDGAVAGAGLASQFAALGDAIQRSVERSVQNVLVRANQSEGDAVRWESEAGGAREPDSVRYGVVVNPAPDDAPGEWMVAVYQPTEDYDGWEPRGETQPMSEDSLERVGGDGVGSLPPVSSVTSRSNADADADADGDDPDDSPDDGEPAADADADADDDDDDGDGDGDGDGDDDGQSDPDDDGSESQSNEPAESGADDISQNMKDRVKELVEDHGFKEENLPDPEEDCFDRIYDAFATDGGVAADGGGGEGDGTDNGNDDGGNGDGDGDGDGQSDPDDDGGVDDGQGQGQGQGHVQGQTQPDAPTTPTAGDGAGDGDGDAGAVTNEDALRKVIRSEMEEFVDERINQAFEEQEAEETREQHERAILSSDAPFDEEDLQEMNDEAVAKIAEVHAGVDGAVEQQQAQQQARANFAGIASPPEPSDDERVNSDEIEVTPGNYGEWKRQKEGGD